MVDFGEDDLVGKSTAHTELVDQLWQRDSDAGFTLSMFNHKQKLQKTYAQCLKDGWSADDMKSEQSMDWLTMNVAWRIEQSAKVDYDYDYFRLAYDTDIEAGFLIDATRKTLDFASGDDATGGGAAGGGASLKVSPVLDPLAHSPWMVADDHEVQDTGGMQAGIDVDENLWRRSPAEDTVPQAKKYQAEIDAAVQQLAASHDAQLIIALQAKISVLEAQQRRQVLSQASSDFKSPLGNKLPEKLVDSYDFTKSNITIVEHLEKLGDFLLLRKDKQYFIHFLIQTLAGDTLRLFREQRATPDMSYQDAKLCDAST